MNRKHLRWFLIVCVIGALGVGLLSSEQSKQAEAQGDVLGYHTIRGGEWLYSIARAYQVGPQAIATASGLFSTSQVLQPGWVLTIPNVPKYIAPGPTAVRQFGAQSNVQDAPVPAPQPVEHKVLASAGGLSPAWPQNIQQWKGLIEAHAAAHGLDPDLVAAIMTVESAGRVGAVSVSNARGLMQVMPREAGYPGRPSAAELMDPTTNIAEGCRILAASGVAGYYGHGKVKTAWYVAEVWRIYSIYHR